ncbi:hypothetical protein TIFTF001_015237 [Ficus carica]|uniref:Uncharacterized protein n=1 Tax=Ficus carica TaxID=3494 RepID=A0AA88A5B3_FICCA|nr:hypothetical protein TIFTF001_015237 [Ficus carica]
MVDYLLPSDDQTNTRHRWSPIIVKHYGIIHLVVNQSTFADQQESLIVGSSLQATQLTGEKPDNRLTGKKPDEQLTRKKLAIRAATMLRAILHHRSDSFPSLSSLPFLSPLCRHANLPSCRHELRRGYRGFAVTIYLHQLQQGVVLPRSFDRGPCIRDPLLDFLFCPILSQSRASAFAGLQSSDHDLVPLILPLGQRSGNQRFSFARS